MKFIAQISIPAFYNQGFGTTDINSWTNNSTFNGWYYESTGAAATFQTHIDITSTAVISNNGGYYSYECNSDNNQKIGTRPSNSVGSANGTDADGNDNGIYIGVRFKNNTGNICTSVKVSYTGYQLSLAQNGGDINQLKFGYKISNLPITTLLGTGWTLMPSLYYTAPNNSLVSGSAQISSYVCTSNSAINGCIISGLNIPNGSEIMFRWGDLNNVNNDPHLAIDDVNIEFFSDNICTSVLPIELLDFYGTKNGNQNDVTWKVALERNILYYVIEKSDNAFNFTELGTVFTNDEGYKTYTIVDEKPYNDITYYRLNTKESSGEIIHQQIISVDNKDTKWQYVVFNLNNELHIDFKTNLPKQSSISLFDITGKSILTQKIMASQNIINTDSFAKGLYFVQIITPYKTENFKVVIP